MARMNNETRLQLGEKMVETWTAADLGNSKSCNFVKDMLHRMRSGRAMSPKQRVWFDKVMQQELPKNADTELTQALKKAATVPGMERQAGIINDFVGRLAQGWSLTEKQLDFAHALVQKADDCLKNGLWKPTEKEAKEIFLGYALAMRYTSFYLQNVPSLYNALNDSRAWFLAMARNDQEALKNAQLSQQHAQILMSSCKGQKHIMQNFTQDCPKGTLMCDMNGNPCLIISEPFVKVDPKSTIGHPMGSWVGYPHVNAMQAGKFVEIPLNWLQQIKKNKRGKGANE